MMGLLGNVAEVKQLRSRLMTTEYISVFSELLASRSDGIEVSYNAAGVLAHIASDGADAWTIETPSREEVLDRMIEAIGRWNLEAERNINYRSFEPILGLIKCYDTPACQLWAIWALANLTKVTHPENFKCQIIIIFVSPGLSGTILSFS
jgi:Zyg-11 family protein